MQSPQRARELKPGTSPNHRLRLRKLGLVCAGLAALALLLRMFYAEENWRGNRAWAAYQRVLKAKGVEFNWKALAPPPVTDGNNFAMTPFFAALFDYTPGTHTPRDMAAYNRTAGFGQTGAPYLEQRRASDPIPAMSGRKRTDLAGGLRLFREARGRVNRTAEAASGEGDGDRTAAATAVLEALARFNPVLDELRVASRRSQARFNFSYDEENVWRMPQPHLPVLKRVSTVLTLRASAELALRNADAAANEVRLILTLANSVREEPFPSSQRARNTMLADARQIIWEGLADRRWSDGQLREFQLRLQELALLSDAQGPLRLELASVNKLFDDLRAKPALVKTLQFGPGVLNRALPYFLWLMPAGWICREQACYNHTFEERLLPALDTETAAIKAALIDQAGHGSSPVWNHCLVANVLLQSVSSRLTGAAFAQSGINQTILACALERYRLASGQLPETLGALSPQCLSTIPPDVTAGQPMKYRRTEDGRFQLYSIGWDGKDDGGKVVMNQDGKTADVTRGDWVWPQYPDERLAR